eukprot:gene11245-biopygen22873
MTEITANPVEGNPGANPPPHRLKTVPPRVTGHPLENTYDRNRAGCVVVRGRVARLETLRVQDPLHRRRVNKNGPSALPPFPSQLVRTRAPRTGSCRKNLVPRPDLLQFFLRHRRRSLMWCCNQLAGSLRETAGTPPRAAASIKGGLPVPPKIKPR